MDTITTAEYSKGKKLLAGAIAAPLLLAGIPKAITLALTLLLADSPPTAAVILFFGVVVTVVGFLIGLIISGVLLSRRAKWTKELRERIAADGIRAEELDWFRHELKSNEKRALKAVEARDLLLGDAYRETLASRLTATRIIRSARKELALANRRKGSVKNLKSSRSAEFQTSIESDIQKLTSINDEARTMLAEAETRLHMIEAAATRQGDLAGHELALKKLSARTTELPLALEAAKMSEQIRLELEERDKDDIPSTDRKLIED